MFIEDRLVIEASRCGRSNAVNSIVIGADPRIVAISALNAFRGRSVPE